MAVKRGGSEPYCGGYSELFPLPRSLQFLVLCCAVSLAALGLVGYSENTLKRRYLKDLIFLGLSRIYWHSNIQFH